MKDAALTADEHIYTWAAQDSENARKIWEEHGGKSLKLDDADAKQFIKDASASADAVFAGHPKLLEDYKVFKAVAEKYRQK